MSRERGRATWYFDDAEQRDATTTAHGLRVADRGVTRDTGKEFSCATVSGSASTWEEHGRLVNIQDEGNAVVWASTINFVGAGVEATSAVEGVATVTIPGGGGESLTETLAIGDVTSGEDIKLSGEDRLVSGYGSGGSAENDGIAWRTARRYVNTGSGSDGWVTMGAAILGASAADDSDFALVRVVACGRSSRGGGAAPTVLEELWDTVTGLRVSVVTSTGDTSFRLISTASNDLSIQVLEHSGAGFTRAFALIDVTHLRHIPS